MCWVRSRAELLLNSDVTEFDRQEFFSMLERPEAIKGLVQLGVDHVAAKELGIFCLVLLYQWSSQRAGLRT